MNPRVPAVSQILKRIRVFCGTGEFIAMLTKGLELIPKLSYIGPVNPIPASHITISIFRSDLPVSLPDGLFHTSFATMIVYAFFFASCAMQAVATSSSSI
jgi:hypothetical protein